MGDDAVRIAFFAIQDRMKEGYSAFVISYGSLQYSWAYDGNRVKKWHGGDSPQYGEPWAVGTHLLFLHFYIPVPPLRRVRFQCS